MKISEALIYIIGEAGGAVPGWQFAEWLKVLERLEYLEVDTTNGPGMKLTEKGKKKLDTIRRNLKTFQL